MATISLSRTIQRLWLPRTTIRSLSTTSNGNGGITPTKPIENLVSGVTLEKLHKDPSTADFMRANFPEHFESEEEEQKAEQSRVITNWGERRRSIPKPHLNIRSMATLLRCNKTEEGSNRCFPMRDQHNLIPGVIYGGDPTKGISGRDDSQRIFVKTPRPTLQSEIDRYHYLTFQGRVYDLTVYETLEQMEAGQDDGFTHRVVPRDVQLHPVNDMVYCCNFVRYYPGRPIKIPVTLINEEESPALKRDGFLIPINKFVECVVDDGKYHIHAPVHN
jgi:hypothetical protein